MSPYIAQQSLILEMAKALRDFASAEDALKRLQGRGYTLRDIKAYGPAAVRWELRRRKLAHARAA
ncbi:MAG: hypothetical protein Q8M31_21880 [Beijerinckiaceae bacterium]|nr:hypothetical protein [Beijerinckiaceae bacterium]